MSWRRLLLAGALLIGLLFTGWMWWRDFASLRQLKAMLPIPDAIDATAFFSHEQMVAIATVIEKSPVKPRFATTGDVHEVAQLVRESKNPVQMWSLVTRLKPAEVHAFYQSEAHRPGWELTADTPGCCFLLRRGSSQMLVGYGPDRAGRGTEVFYSLSIEGQKTAP